MTESKAFRSLSRQLILRIILFSAFITLLLTSLQLYIEYRHDVLNVTKSLEQIEHSHLRAIENALWQLDRQQIQVQTDGILELPDIVFVEVVSDSGRIASSGSLQNVMRQTAQTFPLQYEYDTDQAVLGELNVIASLDNVYANLIARAGMVLIANGIKTFLVALFITVLFNRTLTRYLVATSDFFRKMEFSRLSEPFTLQRDKRDRSHAQDELDLLESSVNTFKFNLERAFGEIDTANERYRWLVQNSSEFIYRVGLRKPISIFLPVEDQIGLIYKHAYIAEWNAAVEKKFRYSEQQLRALKLSRLYPLSVKRNRLFMERFVRNDYRVHEQEVGVPDENGNMFTVLRNLAGVVEDDHLVYVWGQDTDITELVNTRKKLEDNLDYLKAMDRISSALQGSHDPDGRLRNVLTVIMKLFGADRAWFLYPNDPGSHYFRVPLQVFRPEFPGAGANGELIPLNDQVSEILDQTLNSEEPVEFCMPCAQLEHPRIRIYKVLSQIGIVLKPDYGRPWILGMHQCRYPRRWTDEEKLLLKELAQRLVDPLGNYVYNKELEFSQSRLEEAQSTAHIGHWEYETKTKKLSWSDEFYRILGYPPRAFEPSIRAFYRRVHRDDITQALIDAESAINRAQSHEYRIVREDGAVRYINGLVRSRAGERGKPERFFGVIQDVTEKRLLEKVNRDQELQLIQADKMSSLGLMVSGVAHEVNNPNNLIQINASLLKDVWTDTQPILDRYAEDHKQFLLGGLPYEDATESMPDLLNGLTDASRRIERIVNDLKNFARRSDSVVNEEVDVNAAIESSIRLLGPLIKSKTHYLHVALADNLPKISINRQHVEQIVINLLTNALDALPDKHHAVYVTTQLNDTEENIEIVVRDEGMGMPESMLSKVFEPFYTTKQDTGGTGLGLAIVYNLVKMHGGRVNVSSSNAQGTVFTVEFAIRPSCLI